jgi:hypothetical protein
VNAGEHDHHGAALTVAVAWPPDATPVVLLAHPAGHWAMDGPSARQLAGALLNAADEWDEVTP